jgi:hypothetical protein
VREPYKTGQQHETSMASAHISERREVRYEITCAIEVSGIGGNGQVFHERTVTQNVSEWGCAFETKLPLQVEDMVAIRLISECRTDSTKQALFQVVRAEQEGSRRMIGAWRVGGQDLWEGLTDGAKAIGGARETRKEPSVSVQEERE